MPGILRYFLAFSVFEFSLLLPGSVHTHLPIPVKSTQVERMSAAREKRKIMEEELITDVIHKMVDGGSLSGAATLV
jgi:hypothetical protein